MNFFNALFDIRFRQMVTGQIISVLYILAMIGIAIAFVVTVVGAFVAQGIGGGIFTLIIGAIVAILALCYVRVMLELFVVMFRIYENTSAMAGRPADTTVRSSAGGSSFGGPAMGGSTSPGPGMGGDQPPYSPTGGTPLA